MYSIFYDLETSDKNTIGQIINYAFIVVDKNFKIVDELCGKIKLSCLQLPSPSAILANRTDLLLHQKEAVESEKEAMLSIAQFIDQQIQKFNQKVYLIGYNSTRFDLPYLRTSLIRNGLNPYFSGKLIYKDLLLAARKLSLSHEGFPRAKSEIKKLSADNLDAPKEDRLSLSLQTLSQQFGILKGTQRHESREDVLLTIDLARRFVSDFDLDVRVYDSYEAAKFHHFKKGSFAINSLSPQYDLSEDSIYIETPMTLLDVNHRYALWINLDRYVDGEGSSSIFWYNQNGGALFCNQEPIQDEHILDIAEEAVKELQGISLKNFFTKSTCDIEQDIYRLDVSLIDSLNKAIWYGKKDAISSTQNKDAKVILLRNELANYTWGGKQDKEVSEMLKKYAIYRYGGQAKLSKFDSPEVTQDKEESSAYHATLKQMILELDTLSKSANKEDLSLLDSLMQFYKESAIYINCSKELLA